MDREAVSAELRGIFAEYLEGRGIELIDLLCRYEGRDLFLRVLVDKPEGGVTLGECAEINRDMAGILDEKNILTQRYILEVSSPGLDRPMKTKNDFLRCRNRKAKFFLSEAVSGRIEWDGIISRVDNDTVYIDTGREVVEIPLTKINKAKQILE
ncbi:MAG: ribosome maturation factor RimP [Candidatus Omnitrophica bacterium]|nr:ribosome maturation factor RimP [Candidatus Omnitrophota bacterium]